MKFTEDLLKQMPQEALIQLVLMLQQNINQLNQNVELLTEQIRIMNQRNYGRSTEKASELFELQHLDLIFNEAEYTADENSPEPTIENLP